MMQSNIVLSPIKVKHIGRPRSSRMVSEMEKAVKKSQRKANKPPIDNNVVPRSRKNRQLKLHCQVGVPVDPTMELSKLLFEHNFEKALNVALQSNDISIVSWLCSTVDLRWVLSLAPLPLSQGVLLNLLWQLACDIKNNSPQKLAWMTVVANSMVPTDPGIAMHGKPILFQIYAILNHQCTLPTITYIEISSIRLLMHAVNSMLIVVN
ncbi:Enhancer of mRNA-decapping protein 4 [Morella rubra]|uniref:Enhancer of mRNA-decapping protein 4 n=1 Tax=Morella rubra TaxID=262757 RepID=A0A6A1UUK8_9ROSI|nr:Enhancer of mRNA-decapping protein 4 [Morella rubra]